MLVSLVWSRMRAFLLCLKPREFAFLPVVDPFPSRPAAKLSTELLRICVVILGA